MNTLEQKNKPASHKPNVLSFDSDDNIIMTLTWDDWSDESLKLEDFLHLTDLEKKEIKENYKKLWYFLLWDKLKWWPYPEYFKDFHDTHEELFLWSKELTRERDPISKDDISFPNRKNRELIFVKLNIPSKLPPRIEEEIWKYEKIIYQILWLTK